MAIVTPLRSLFLSTTLLPSLPLSYNRCFSLSLKTKSKPQITYQSVNKNGDAAIVWFKHDLRIDDHPGIAAASNHSTVVPIYVFDPRILSRFPDEMVELVLLAVEDLRRSLKERGSNLMIKFGNVENVLHDLVKEIKATVLYGEEEVEYDMRTLIATLEEFLAADPVLDWKPKIKLWRTSVYDAKNLDDLPTFFKDMKKPQHNDLSLVGSPRLPTFHMELDWGHVPTINDVSKLLESRANTRKEQWHSIKQTSAEAALRMDHKKLFESSPVLGESRLSKSGSISRNSDGAKIKRRKDSVFCTFNGNIVAGGTEFVLNALAGYLRYLEGTSRDDWIHQRLQETEIRTGASFGALFGPVLQLGIISCRRVYYEAIRYKEERNAGFLSPLGYSTTTVDAAINAVCSIEASEFEKSFSKGGAILQEILEMEWKPHSDAEGWPVIFCSLPEEHCSLFYDYLIHNFVWGYLQIMHKWLENLAWLKFHPNDVAASVSGSVQKISKLFDYTVIGHEGPAVLLVHGFGAFFEHYRHNLSYIADKGNRVWALTLLGFGQSEKPTTVYSELMWAELLRDFIIEVVGEQAHLVGNSIGGYFSSIVGGLWPSLVKSIVLVNTAGDVVPGYSSLLFFKERKISGAAWLGSRALLQYLRFSTRNLVKNCYPTRPERADDWLITEMLRASYDPGSIEVLESVFSVNLSIPLNHLLRKFKGKVLIIQGMKDPIADSSSRLAMFRKHCEGIEIKELDAGHCPHDECPEEVNDMICKWILTTESSIHIDSSVSLSFR